MFKRFKKSLKRFTGILPCFLLFPASSFAASTDVQETLQRLIAYITGPVGVSIATLAIIGLGIGCFVLGRVSKPAFFSTFSGIALVFGAGTFTNYLAGGVGG